MASAAAAGAGAAAVVTTAPERGLSNPYNHRVHRTIDLFLPHGLVLSFVKKQDGERARNDRAFFAASKLEVDVAEKGCLKGLSQSGKIAQIASHIHAHVPIILEALASLIASYAGYSFHFSDCDPFYAHGEHPLYPRSLLPSLERGYEWHKQDLTWEQRRRNELQFRGPPQVRRICSYSVPAIYVSPMDGTRDGVSVFHTLPTHVSYTVRHVTIHPSDDFTNQLALEQGEYFFVPRINGVEEGRFGFLLVLRSVSDIVKYGTPFRLDTSGGGFYPPVLTDSCPSPGTVTAVAPFNSNARPSILPPPAKPPSADPSENSGRTRMCSSENECILS